MAYRIQTACPGMEMAVRNIAVEQIDGALAVIARAKKSPHKSVHEVRKTCKRLRGLLRLIEPGFGKFAKEDKAVGKAARRLSSLRDAAAMVETFDALKKWSGGAMNGKEMNAVRAVLTARRADVQAREGDILALLKRASKTLKKVRKRAKGWRLAAEGPDAVMPGLEKTYAKGRRAIDRAYATYEEEGFHRWRKKVKYLGHHADLLRAPCGKHMSETARRAEALGDILGDEHNLTVFRATIETEADAFGGPEAVFTLLAKADIRQCELRAAARQAGAELYADTPDVFAARCRGAWERSIAEAADRKRAAEEQTAEEKKGAEAVTPPAPKAAAG